MTACDVLVVGGGLGGCAAAIAAARAGHHVVLTEETDWIGGQLTAQGVPPDEHPWIEEFGCTRTYRALRDGIRAHYGGVAERLNPGGGWVSRLCAEPRVSWKVLAAMVAEAGVEVHLGWKPVGATVEGDQIRSVRLWNPDTDEEVTQSARFFIDATELGDLLPLAGVEYRLGAESKMETDEPNAVEGPAQPDNIQGLTWCFAMEFGPPSEPIARPESYERWRAYRPDFWPGPLLGFEVLHAHTGEPRTLPLWRSDGNFYALFPYRQIVDPKVSPGRLPTTLVNWPQNDYFLKSILDVDPPGCRSGLPGASGPVSEAALRDSIELSLCLLYWMQTEAPRHDGGTGYPECQPARSTFAGGPRVASLNPELASAFAKFPYIRESRRIVALHTIREQDVAAYTNPGRDRAPEVPDSVGVGAYRIDLHPSTSGANTIDTSTLPFQIPLRSLVPIRVENFLPACKNIGTTHVTNGCYRLHPVEWNIGEAVGTLVSLCLSQASTPQEIALHRVTDLQDHLAAQGVELDWPAAPLRAL